LSSVTIAIGRSPRFSGLRALIRGGFMQVNARPFPCNHHLPDKSLMCLCGGNGRPAHVPKLLRPSGLAPR
jgi:hypothetical protein